MTMVKILLISCCVVLSVASVGCTRKFSLNDDRLIDRSARHDDGQVRISQNPDGSYHISGQVMTTFNPGGGSFQNIWADGVTHTWIGKVSYQRYVFDSDSSKPLIFRVDKDNGYTYVGGKGTVTSPEGKSTSLP
jgi:hypothetical protein